MYVTAYSANTARWIWSGDSTVQWDEVVCGTDLQFLSAITAIIGMFIGVAIGNSEEDGTAWILSGNLYVALQDLV